MRCTPTAAVAPSRLAVALLFVALQSGPAYAQAVGSGDDALRWFVEKEVAGLGRVEVKLGSLAPRLQLAPCRRIEPYVPAGARLWGRSAIGVRCVDGASWNVSLPITVTVWGRALVAASALAAGVSPSASDVREQEVELTREPTPPLTDLTQVGGRVLNRPIAAGQPLRQDMLRVAMSVQAGDPIKLVLLGDGFAVNADGQALAAAGDGQSVRVRTESGRIVVGTLRGRTVEVRL